MTEKLQNNGKVQQVLTTLILNLLALTNGIGVGWPSPVIPQLKSNNPPIGDAPMSEDEVSWIGGLLAIGGLFTIPFCGILVERLGRKRFAQLTALPYLASWLLIIFAQNYIHLYAARYFLGMGAAMLFLIVPLYVSEIASDDIRGNVGSLLLFSLNIGILLAYVAGAFLSYHLFASLALMCPVFFLAASIFIPETPVYLVRRSQSLQAHKSLMFFRGNNDVVVDQELSSIKSQISIFDRSAKNVQIRDLFKDRATRKGLVLSIGLLGGQQLSGIFAMMSYAETIFNKAGSSVSAETASIIIAAIQIVGSYFSTFLMDRAGRRPLQLTSSFIMALSHGMLGLFFYLQQHNYNVSSIAWVPLVVLSIYIIIYCIGVGPVPLVVVSEVFNLEVSSVATNFCFTIQWIIILIAIKAFDWSMKYLGADGCFFMHASFCMAICVFTYCLLPETKGRKREDIVDELAGIKKSNDNEKFDVNECA